ncbi:hypothetical protein CPB83DRAFT_480756 [Crepidotus variabilis]|uniref:Uncharacterized protein n=1 Tax=Crepidotus variabilis TaxID=179855 RepID=A0A9P6JVL6_9AGAR|nr:hypothetical protein CPB83DRAFT_480756 [Crepidotus variabilis]
MAPMQIANVGRSYLGLRPTPSFKGERGVKSIRSLLSLHPPDMQQTSPNSGHRTRRTCTQKCTQCLPFQSCRLFPRRWDNKIVLPPPSEIREPNKFFVPHHLRGRPDWDLTPEARNEMREWYQDRRKAFPVKFPAWFRYSDDSSPPSRSYNTENCMSIPADDYADRAPIRSISIIEVHPNIIHPPTVPDIHAQMHQTIIHRESMASNLGYHHGGLPASMITGGIHSVYPQTWPTAPRHPSRETPMQVMGSLSSD